MTYEEIELRAKFEGLNVLLPEADKFLGKEYYDNMTHIVGVVADNFIESTRGYARNEGVVFVVGDTARDVRGYLRGIMTVLGRSGTPFRHTYSTNTIRVA